MKIALNNSKIYCEYYQVCNAPLCPMCKNSLSYCVWYADEDICSLRKFSKLLWIKNQRKIKKFIIESDGYFIVDMLDRKFRITKALKGIDSDKGREAGEETNRWFKKHPLLKAKKVTTRSLEALKMGRYNRNEREKDTVLIVAKGGIRGLGYNRIPSSRKVKKTPNIINEN